jgi:hypothetical protein
MQNGLVCVGLGVAAWLSLRAWRAGRSRLVELAAVVGLGVVGNAFVTGVLSSVDGRYQSRVVWLLVAVALLLTAANRQTGVRASVSPSQISKRPRIRPAPTGSG